MTTGGHRRSVWITYANATWGNRKVDRAMTELSIIGPDRSTIRALVVDAVSSPKSKALYGHAVDDFLGWYTATRPGPLSKAVVNAWRVELERRGLAASSINVRLAAIRKLASEATDNGLLAPEVAAGVLRVKGAKTLGARLGNWLAVQQAQALLSAPEPTTLKGRRDQAMLAAMLGAGLRRSEVAALTVEHLQQREGRWVVVDLVGKHGRVRSVPIASWIKASIDRWTTAASIATGPLFRPVNKGNKVGTSGMTAQAVYNVLVGYANGWA